MQPESGQTQYLAQAAKSFQRLQTGIRLLIGDCLCLLRPSGWRNMQLFSNDSH